MNFLGGWINLVFNLDIFGKVWILFKLNNVDMKIGLLGFFFRLSLVSNLGNG